MGALLFQAPAPPLFVPGVQLADTQSPECPQGPVGMSPTDPLLPKSIPTRRKRQAPNPDEIEDCLFLKCVSWNYLSKKIKYRRSFRYVPSVHVSGKLNAQAKMPVVFWIHGGG